MIERCLKLEPAQSDVVQGAPESTSGLVAYKWLFLLLGISLALPCMLFFPCRLRYRLLLLPGESLHQARKDSCASLPVNGLVTFGGIVL